MPHSLEELISEKDISYEQELVKEPDNLDTWLKYYSTKSEGSLIQKVFILERAVNELPKSEELWLIYVDVLVEHASKLNYYHHRLQFNRVNFVFDRAISLLNTSVPLWSRYVQFLVKQYGQVSRIRNKFNLALFNIPVSSHGLIWPLYLEFANLIGGITASKIYQKYMQFEGEAADLEEYVERFIEFGDSKQALAVYEKLIGSGKSKATSIVNVCKDYLDLLLSDEFENTVVREKVEEIVNRAVSQWPDQLAYFTLRLISYFKSENNHQKVRYLYGNGIRQCANTHDFVEIYNSYVEYEEHQLLNVKDDQELDFRMSIFENLLSDRPLLLNEMKLRQDSNNLDHWFERIELFTERLDKKLQTYTFAISQVNPLKAHSELKTLVDLWVQYADEYASKNDYTTANIIYSKSTTSQFKSLDQLAELYIKWSEFCLLSDAFEDPDARAVKVIEDVLSKTEDVEVNDNTVDIHRRIHKSPKLWAYYLDLLDSFVEDVNQNEEINRVSSAYERLIESKLATPQNFITYASFLQRMKRIEKSFQVYENGLAIFKDSYVRFEIWNVYLSKVIHYKLKVERVRDLFEQSLLSCPSHLCIPVVILYAKYELDNGLLMKSIKIIKEGVKMIIEDSGQQGKSGASEKALADNKFTLYRILASQAVDDVSLVRETFQFILQDNQLTMPQLNEMAFQFIDFEVKNTQLARVRELFQFVGRSYKVNEGLWLKWENFELDFGNEETFKEMLRFKREVAQGFSKDTIGTGSIAFIKSEPKQAQQIVETSNPEEIELDM